MNLITELRGDVLVARISDYERLDAHISREFKEKIMEQIKNGYVNIIVDLHNIQVVDSSGLGALVSIMKNAKVRDGDIKLVACNPTILALLDITRLNKVFGIYNTLEEAVSSYSI